MRKAIIALSMLASMTSGAESAAADGPPREVVVNGVEFVLVPEGWFWHSVENGDITQLGVDEPMFRDVHLWIDAFYIAKYEARARDFERFMNSGDARVSEQYRNGEVEGCGVQRDAGGRYFLVEPEMDLPATHLSWQLSDEFAAWMGFRLPTEMEWVKAARGTDQRIWPWGDEYPDDTFAGFGFDANCNPTSVTEFPKGASPFGAYNMAGNVYEYVADWYNPEHDATLQDGMRNPPIAASGSTSRNDLNVPNKILKGGRWGSAPQSITVRERQVAPPEFAFLCYGVRFAVDVATVQGLLADEKARVVQP